MGARIARNVLAPDGAVGSLTALFDERSCATSTPQCVSNGELAIPESRNRIQDREN